jgi:CubicO group peptidase (beta-lactamase class C family)
MREISRIRRAVQVWAIALPLALSLSCAGRLTEAAPSAESAPSKEAAAASEGAARSAASQAAVAAAEGAAAEGGLATLASVLAADPERFHSFLLSVEGETLVEAYSWPRTAEDKHKLASVTKSVLSILLGMAIDEGKIGSLDAALASFFPEAAASWPEDKRRVTLRHLITMTDGLSWREDGSYSGPDDSFTQMKTAPNAVDYVLSRPLDVPPGSRFDYNSGASHLLSAVLGKAVGAKASEYAATRLFDPLDIEDWIWREDGQGVTYGCDGLMLRPRDLLKIGQLLASGGLWEGRRLVSREWIEASTRKAIDSPRGLAGRYGYGMHWWMNPSGGFSGRGYGGQFLFVIPEKGVVAVFTGGIGSDFFRPETLMRDCVASAAPEELRSQAASPAVREYLQVFSATPRGGRAMPPPPIARRIEGRKVALADGSVSVFSFPSDGEGTWMLGTGGPPSTAPMGMDGLPRRGELASFGGLPGWNPVTLEASWASEDTLAVELRLIYDFYTYDFRFTFYEDGTVRETCDVPEIGSRIEDLRGRIE